MLTTFISRFGVPMATIETGPRTRSHPCVITGDEADVIQRVAERAAKASALPSVDDRDDYMALIPDTEVQRG